MPGCVPRPFLPPCAFSQKHRFSTLSMSFLSSSIVSINVRSNKSQPPLHGGAFAQLLCNLADRKPHASVITTPQPLLLSVALPSNTHQPTSYSSILLFSGHPAFSPPVRPSASPCIRHLVARFERDLDTVRRALTWYSLRRRRRKGKRVFFWKERLGPIHTKTELCTAGEFARHRDCWT